MRGDAEPEKGASPSVFERISECATADLASLVEFKRTRGKVSGADKIAPFSLRATTILRREDGEWRIVHRNR